MDPVSQQLHACDFALYYDCLQAKQVDSPESAFTRRREVLVGRLAMSGFFALVVGELITGVARCRLGRSW